MKKFPLLLLFIFTLYSTSFAQSKNKSGKITGTKTKSGLIVATWKLIEFTDLDTLTGKWIYRYGKNPRGYFTYTKSGVVNINISTDSPLKISEEASKKYSINLYDYIRTNSFGYFGTYTVDLEKSTVTHHVTGGTIPWYTDTDQPRPFYLKNDTLIISDKKTHKRVLVRVN